jgi:hypothetical protein
VCFVTQSEFNSLDCGLGGCPDNLRCVPLEYQEYFDNTVVFVCKEDANCHEEQCGNFGQPCCQGMYNRCNQGVDPNHPVLICENEVCIDDYMAGPIGELFPRRPGSDMRNYYTNIGDLLAAFYKVLYPGAIILGVAFFIKGGYQYMTSEGDPKKIQLAQQEITRALLGALFVLATAAILRVIISSFLGVNTEL